MRVRSLVGLIACALIPHVASAQWAGWDDEFDEGKKSWKEIEAKIPAYPNPKNLVSFEAGGAGHRIYIDGNSVSLGEDGVMRYTLVLKTPGGATNVSFEGIRCETREQKIYALGRSDGSWARARDPKWRRIELREYLPYHYVLYREYFCPSKARAPTAREAVEALKQSRGFVHTDEGRQRP